MVSLADVDIVCSDHLRSFECQDTESSQLLLLEAVLIQAHVHRKVSGGLISSCFPPVDSDIPSFVKGGGSVPLFILDTKPPNQSQ